MKINIVVLEFIQGVFQGNPYKQLLARYNNRVLKFKLASDIEDLNKYVDREVSAEIEIVAGQNLAATLRIVAIVAIEEPIEINRR
jgi:hypothetical protein